jgi:hypothetical protein
MATASEPSESRSLEPGVRGWLSAFLVWLGVISPLWTIGLSAVVVLRLNQANPGDAAIMHDMGWDVLLWVVTILRAGTRIVAAALMYFRRVPASVWVALATLWFSGPALIIGPWLLLHGEMNVPGLVRSAAIALAWTIFLLVSRRVKSTYGFRATA